MTREELKEHCDKQIEMCEMWAIQQGKKPSGNIYEEHKLILELLEQEPCEDVIDRVEAMTEIMMFAGNVKSDEEDIYIKVSDAVQLLRDLPSVMARPKTGYWVKYCMPRCEEQHYKCTSCEYYINFGRWGEFYSREFKYCPHCGAEMKRKIK